MDLATSPEGTGHVFAWAAASDLGADVRADQVRFRIAVEWQAPDHAGAPLQRPRLAAASPPFPISRVQIRMRSSARRVTASPISRSIANGSTRPPE